MKNGLKRLVAGIGLSAAMLGIGSCPLPTTTDDNHRSWADLEFIVEGGNGVNTLNNIYYGRIDKENGNWEAEGPIEYPIMTGSVNLPWNSGNYHTCTGHWVRVSSTSGQNPGSFTLKIKDKGKITVEKEFNSNGFIWGGKLDYYITTLK